MAINEYKTRTGVELVAEGELKRVQYHPLKEIKDYGKDGQSWKPTHSVSLRIDEDWISAGLMEVEEGKTLRRQDSGGEWHDLEEGDEISIVVEEGEYKGKPSYSGRLSSVIITKKGAGAPAKASGGGSGGGKSTYDQTGVSTGHAINCAMQLLVGDAVDKPEEVIELAKKFHALTISLLDEYVKTFPEQKSTAGARVGQSVLSAAGIVGDFESVEAVARVTLYEIAPVIYEHIKGESKPAAAEKKTVAKKAAKKATKAAPAKEEKEEQYQDNLADMDDDIPFN